MEIGKKKATFNLGENTHQGLKLASAVRKREMVDLVEEALNTYFGWNKMTDIEKEELKVYRIAERNGAGREGNADFTSLGRELGEPNEVVEQLLVHLHSERRVVLKVNDGQTGFRDYTTFPEGPECLYRNGGYIRLQLTIPGRLRFQQLTAREEWERNQAATPVPEKS